MRRRENEQKKWGATLASTLVMLFGIGSLIVPLWGCGGQYHPADTSHTGESTLNGSGDLNEKRDGATPLMRAVKWGRTEEALRLVRAGADPNIKSSWGGGLPLNCAIGGDYRLVKALLEHGADPNLRDNAGCMAIHDAAGKGSSETLRLLLKYNASINARYDVLNQTPLHIAVDNGNIEAVRVLVNAGADINAEADPPIGTPLNQALELSEPDLMGDPEIDAWERKIARRSRIIVDILKRHGARR